MRSILVEDASGAQLMLYEYQDRGPVMSLYRLESRFELETGEQAEVVDENTFVVKRTGERLLRVR
ncbi:MAG: hypothetical protein QOD54_38 [Sphingomonadales bacterium]|jgi:hypothetical protein|nr:hypothetical protein [Sphingomonadales bacterium]